MNNLTNLKTIGQNSVNQLIDLGKQQPEEVKTWGITAAGAVAGSLILNAGAQGLLSVLSVLASLPVSLTVGAIGGGALGWMYVQQQKAMVRAYGQGSQSSDEKSSEDVQEIVVESTIPTIIADIVIENSDETNDSTPEPMTLLEMDGAENNVSEETATVPMFEFATAPQDTVKAAITELPSEHASDRLESINGIGPAFARHLHSAGIHTFAQLAELSPEQLQEIMSASRGGKLIEAARWIDQAKQLAATK